MWIIPSNLPLSSASALEFLGSKEGLNELASIPVSWPTWKSKPSSLQTWLRGWKRVYWIPHLFGRTLKPSMHDRFVERYTASLEDIHVSHSVLSESKMGVSTNNTYGQTSEQQLTLFAPPLLFFENVVNHLHIGYQQVKNDLEELRYTVKEGIYSASEIGASHRRERLYILALDHTQCEGLEGFARHVIEKAGREKSNRSIGAASIFPRARGISQWDWEEPRTNDAESRLGCTIDGYNFREDLLRATGNSVVEQTAELAFIDLIGKHLKNL